jgi:hypothetical protein
MVLAMVLVLAANMSCKLASDEATGVPTTRHTGY